jgi:uncharacterized protein (TIGR00251 family)
MPLKITRTADGLCFGVKVVPNSSRATVVGLLGDALKVKIAQPPEAGRANQGLVALLSDTLEIPAAQIRVVAGHSQPHKRVAVQGLDESTLQMRLLPQG